MRRRNILKQFGALAGTGVASTAVTATENSPDSQSVNDDWSENNVFESAADNSNPDKIDLGSSLTWYNVDWDDSDGLWEHEFAICSTAAGLDHSGNKQWVIGSNQWQVAVHEGNGNWDLDMQRESNRHGAMPSSNGDIVPDWLEVPVDFAVGAWETSAGGYFTADDLFEALEPLDGMTTDVDDGDFGRRFNHHPSWYETSWAKSTVLQHFEVKHPETTDGKMVVTAQAALGSFVQTFGYVQFEVTFDDAEHGSDSDPTPNVDISVGTGREIP